MLATLTSRIMPRTTLDLDPSVLRELRRRGQSEHKSMGKVASELLARALGESRNDASAHDFAWTSADLGAPLVDLEDKDAVQRALE
jgi:hypothetical protein